MTTVTLDDDGEDVLWYEETGTGPPLVFVHGGWSSAEAWRGQVEAFADDYRVITLDVRGHGQTGECDRRRYSIELFADDLERLLDHLDVERPVLCGLSLGSMIVQEYLGRHPDRAPGAVLAGPVRSMPPVDLPTWTKPFLSPMPALSASLSTVGSEATFRSMLASIRATTGGAWLSADRSVRARAIATAGDVPPAEFRKIFDALYRFDPPDLSHVSTPTLVTYGEREAMPVKRQGEEIAASVDDGTVTEIPDAGHLVNLDEPAAFDDVVASFLDGLDAADAADRRAEPAAVSR